MHADNSVASPSRDVNGDYGVHSITNVEGLQQM